MSNTVGTEEHPFPLTVGDGENGTGPTWGTDTRPIPQAKFPFPRTTTPTDPRIGTVGTLDTPFIVSGVTSAEPPHVITPPVITGQAVVGATLTCTPGTWDGTPAPDVICNWARDNIYIIGTLNHLTYVVTDSDRGHDITCIEEASNIVNTVQAASNKISIPASGFSNGFSSGFK